MENVMHIGTKHKSDNWAEVVLDYEIIAILLDRETFLERPEIRFRKDSTSNEFTYLKCVLSDEQLRNLMLILYAMWVAPAYYEKLKNNIKEKSNLLYSFLTEGKFTPEDFRDAYVEMTRFYLSVKDNEFILERIFLTDYDKEIMAEIKKLR